MLEQAKQLREQASELNKKAEKIEREHYNNLANNLIDRYYFDGENTYYRVTDFDGSLYRCFSLFFDKDNSIVTEFERLMPRELNMKEITKEEAEKSFNYLFDFSKKEFLG